MKKIIFFFVLVIMMMISCTKEESFIYIERQAKDSSSFHVDYKPMPKAVIPEDKCGE